MNKDISPAFHKTHFKCMSCKVYAVQEWRTVNHLYISENGKLYYYSHDKYFEVKSSTCLRCMNTYLWNSNTESIIYPRSSSLPHHSLDLPENMRKIYEEARDVYEVSPRCAAALGRVLLEKLVYYLLEKQYTSKGDDNTEDTTDKENKIKKLTLHNLIEKLDLDKEIKDSCNNIRLLGNEGAHAGEIDFEDNLSKEAVEGLFILINHIIYETITRKREAKEANDKIKNLRK